MQRICNLGSLLLWKFFFIWKTFRCKEFKEKIFSHGTKWRQRHSSSMWRPRFDKNYASKSSNGKHDILIIIRKTEWDVQESLLICITLFYSLQLTRERHLRVRRMKIAAGSKKENGQRNLWSLITPILSKIFIYTMIIICPFKSIQLKFPAHLTIFFEWGKQGTTQ